MKRTVHSLFVLLTPCVLMGQVHVDAPIRLTGANPEDRQVLGLPMTTGPNDALTAGVAQSGELHLATGITGNTWIATLPGLEGAPVAGTQIVVKVPVTTNGPITVLVNGHGPYSLVRGADTVEGQDINTGTMASLIFDGGSMQLINGKNDRRRNCPSGMVASSAQYCIEPDQRAGTDFFNAATTCTQAGRRLCTWSEFHLACANNALGLTGTTDNWEWSNNTANEDNTVRVVGQGTCFSAGTWPATGSGALQYRCCYSR